MPTLKQLQHEYDTTRGLWCIDRHPAHVDYEWIKKNAFQLKDYLKDGNGDEGGARWFFHQLSSWVLLV